MGDKEVNHSFGTSWTGLGLDRNSTARDKETGEEAEASAHMHEDWPDEKALERLEEEEEEED